VIHREQLRWRRIEPGQEREGDVICLRVSGKAWHTAVVAWPGYMLHVMEGTETVLERYDGIKWRCRVEGFYRYE
jgi:hypothetical protein